MLPIELKVTTLGAARAEEELNDLHAESGMIEQLLLRVRLVTGLRQLRRNRVYERETRQARAHAAEDQALLDEMNSSERRQTRLDGQLSSTRRDLTKYSHDLRTLQKRRKQLGRANTRLVSYREDHEGPVRFDDDDEDEPMDDAVVAGGDLSGEAARGGGDAKTTTATAAAAAAAAAAASVRAAAASSTSKSKKKKLKRPSPPLSV